MDAYTIVVVIVYLLITLFLGYLGLRNTKNAKDFLVAGRKTHPLIMALSYGSTFISTAAIVGFGGAAANMGMGLLWLTFLNVFVGIFIAFIFFGKRTRRMGQTLDAQTFPELLGKRFSSKFIQCFSAVLIFVCMPIYAAGVIKGGANFIQTYFGISYKISLLCFVIIVAVYVWTGGLKGVMYTDAFQGGIMFVAMITLLIITYKTLGGVVSAHTQLTALFNNPDPAVQAGIAKSILGGFKGWTSMPKTASPMWWSLVSTIVMGVGIGVLVQPQLVVRFMTVKSNKELNRAVLSGGVFILCMTGIAFVVGALSNVVFFNKMHVLSMAAAGGTSDNIIPMYIKTYIPKWFGAIFLISMLAAAMSTLSSQFHTMGTAAGRDIYEKTMGKKGSTILITRTGIVVAVVVSTLVAFLANSLPAADTIIAKFTTIFFELTTAAFLPAYVGALYFKKMPKAAIIGSMVSGAFTWFIWTFFIHSNSAIMQLCKLIFGKDNLVAGTSLEKLSMVGTTLVALPVSIIVMAIIWIVYAAMKKTDMDKAEVDKCFEGM
jgi:SSS family solute:Na+ symporter